MGTKRQPLRRRQIGSEAEYRAWHEAFTCGCDGFGDLEEFGVLEPLNRIIPVAEMPAEKAAFREVTAEAWRRFGARFMASWQPSVFRDTPWALDEFGAP